MTTQDLHSEILIRTVEVDDLKKGFFGVLSQLTSAETPEESAFKERVKEISQDPNHIVYVVEHIPSQKIIGTITIILEKKFIHNLSQICHVEDFVIDKNYRKFGIGKKLMEMAINFAKEKKCYKIILDCSDELISYYERFGFTKHANGMQLYFK